MPRKIKVAAIAVATVEGMVDANYQRAIRLAEISLSQRPDIILLPEAFAAGYCGVDLTPYGEDIETSPYLAEFRRISREGECMVVTGYLQNAPGGVKNVAAIFDKGELLGTHAKRAMWPDDEMPYRNERALLVAGDALEVFESRFGKLSVLICYESCLEDYWREVADRVDFILSPFNCSGDPSHNNKKFSPMFKVPSAWADRTGTVYFHTGYQPNMGTAGVISADGTVLAMSQPGIEEIVYSDMEIG